MDLVFAYVLVWWLVFDGFVRFGNFPVYCGLLV